MKLKYLKNFERDKNTPGEYRYKICFFIENGWEKKIFLKIGSVIWSNLILAPSYIALFSEIKEGYLLNTAYILEQVILKLWN